MRDTLTGNSYIMSYIMSYMSYMSYISYIMSVTKLLMIALD